jgi:crotonobetainyl-CoA:carnitine CoA-transferase CaiB-like acyl-CoA transferase
MADRRFASERERVANRAEIDRIIGDWTATQEMAPLVEALNRAEIPSSPIHSIADIFKDPQFAARGTIATVQHPVLGEVRMPAIVPRLSETPGEIEWLGRELGADTNSILGAALGYSPNRLSELHARGII